MELVEVRTRGGVVQMGRNCLRVDVCDGLPAPSWFIAVHHFSGKTPPWKWVQNREHSRRATGDPSIRIQKSSKSVRMKRWAEERDIGSAGSKFESLGQCDFSDDPEAIDNRGLVSNFVCIFFGGRYVMGGNKAEANRMVMKNVIDAARSSSSLAIKSKLELRKSVVEREHVLDVKLVTMGNPRVELSLPVVFPREVGGAILVDCSKLYDPNAHAFFKFVGEYWATLSSQATNPLNGWLQGGLGAPGDLWYSAAVGGKGLIDSDILCDSILALVTNALDDQKVLLAAEGKETWGEFGILHAGDAMRARVCLVEGFEDKSMMTGYPASSEIARQRGQHGCNPNAHLQAIARMGVATAVARGYSRRVIEKAMLWCVSKYIRGPAPEPFFPPISQLTFRAP